MNAEFQTTHWLVLRQLKGACPQRRCEALEHLCRTYWPAVYAYLRRSHPPDLAEDLTQAFFADVVLGRALFETADPARGRLRSLIRRALRNFEIDAARRAQIRRTCSLDHSRLAREEASFIADGKVAEPDAAFNRRWAALILEEAVRRCEARFVSSGNVAAWRLFEVRVLRPALGHAVSSSLEEDASRVGYVGSASAAIQYVKRRLRLTLREVIAETTEAGEAAAEETEILDLLTNP
jgi:RNA polymerase sigma-70 factor (ECF subfamily)